MRNQYVDAYRSTLETEVESASPHKLILLLFDGALKAIRQARIHMEKKNIEEKGRLLSQAIMIVGAGLLGSLDGDKSEEIAGNLAALYEYCCSRLVEANLKNDTAILDEIIDLLAGLREAWASIEQQQGGGAVQAPPESQEERPRQGLSYGAA